MIMKNIKKWTAALRSGDYTQGKTRLYIPVDGSYCCLGVAYDVMDPPDTDWRYDIMPGQDLKEWLGIISPENRTRPPRLDTGGILLTRELAPRDDGHQDTHLDYLNDTVDLTFDQIADLIDYFGLVT